MIPEFIGKISLGYTTELRFEISKFKGKDYVNISRFVESAEYTGYTKRGLTLPPEFALQILESLQKYKKSYDSGSEGEICRITKSETVEIIAHIVDPDDPHDTPCIDVREYVHSETYTGWTQRGFRLPLEDLETLLVLLKRCREKLNTKYSVEFRDYNKPVPRIRDNVQTKVQIEKEESPILQLVPESLPSFPTDYLSNHQHEIENWKIFNLPEEPIYLGRMRGNKQEVLSETGHEYLAYNPAEAKYIHYSHIGGHRKIIIPKEPFWVFKIVKEYETFLRDLQKRLIEYLIRKIQHRAAAETLAKKIFKEENLPWIEKER